MKTIYPSKYIWFSYSDFEHKIIETVNKRTGSCSKSLYDRINGPSIYGSNINVNYGKIDYILCEIWMFQITNLNPKG